MVHKTTVIKHAKQTVKQPENTASSGANVRRCGKKNKKKKPPKLTNSM
jgi:hypothetical protein